MDNSVLVRRPEIFKEVDLDSQTVIQRPLSLPERIWDQAAVRKGVLLVVLAAIWQLYAVVLDNPLLVATFTDTLRALYQNIVNGVLVRRGWTSVQILLMGYGLGLALAAVFTILAITTRLGNDLLEVLTALFNPLPSIALLPLALIWFGLGYGSLIFVLVHAVLWPVALNTHSGFRSVSPTLRMVGRNYGLRGPKYVAKILIPAALPSILTGMKIGWAFAWRTLIAAELVFGATSGSGGIGWFIYENKNLLQIANVFAGLLTVIAFGLVVELVIFRTLENRTIRRWGMQN